MAEKFTPRNDQPLMPVTRLMGHATVSGDDIEEAGQRWKDDPPDDDWENLPDTVVVDE